MSIVSRSKQVQFACIAFYSAVFLIKLPPLYFLPIQTRLFTTHVIAKLMLLGISFFIVLDAQYRKKISNNKIYLFPLLFFFSQTLSILSVIDIGLFLKDYQNLLFALALYINALLFFTPHTHTYLERTIILIGVFVLLNDLLYFFSPRQYLAFIGTFVQNEVMPEYMYNLNRGRYNLYLSTELFLPFFINLQITSNTLSKKTGSLLMILGIVFSTIISAFRHRLLFLTVIIFLYGGTFISRIQKKHMITITTYTAILMISVFIFFRVVVITETTNLFERVRLVQIEDVRSITGRIEAFKKALDLFSSAPLVGVGLGQYQLYLRNNTSKYSLSGTMSKVERELALISDDDPHSIISKTISESGIIGLVCYLGMISAFFKKDYQEIRNNPRLSRIAYIASFWGFVALAFITPSTSIFRNGWMWFFRGIIDGGYHSPQ